MESYIAQNSYERIVIIGGGFGGLEIAKSLKNTNYQVVIVDKNNFHQFQPLFYQVATAGLEPSSIIFPFRKNFQKMKNFHFRLAEVDSIDTNRKVVYSTAGDIPYDHLVIATGAGNNFFGNEIIEKHALPMKSISESLAIRNSILERFEESLSVEPSRRGKYLTVVIAGAGPTGVELAGTLVEMRSNILPKDYPELDFKQMQIVLVEGAQKVLNGMSKESSSKAHQYLTNLGVEVLVNTRVDNFDGEVVALSNGIEIESKTLIWAAGIKGNFLDGIKEDARTRGNRILVNNLNEVEGADNVYAIGDVALMKGDKKYPEGHPQLAQVAIQQASSLAKNFKRKLKGSTLVPFRYKNLGTMATIGRNKAVVELPKYKFQGFFAWMVWMLVHLRSILGIKNKFLVFLNWVWNYFTYNLSLRLIIRTSPRSTPKQKED